MTEDTYWAIKDDPKDVINVLEDRVTDYFEKLVTRGIWDVMRRSYRTYYGMSDEGNDHESSLISFVGEQGELSSLKVNHYRNLIRHQLNLAMQAKPEFNPRARNSDARSLSDAKVARGALEYVLKDRNLEDELVLQTEISLWAAWGYMWLTWDENAPGPNGETEGEGSGNICCQALTPLDVISDVARDPRDPDWILVRTLVNKWDLAATFPEHRDNIAATQVTLDTFRYSIGEGPAEDLTNVSQDEIWVYHWYHKRCAAMPDGGYMLFGSQDTVLIPPMALPYAEIPVYRQAPSELVGSPFGYGDNWDLLGLCKAYDAAASTIITNLDSFGVPNVVQQEGTDIYPHEIAGGMNLWTIPRDAQPPQVMQMLNMPAQAFEIPRFLKGEMQDLSGINATMRGSPESNIKSGKMAALFSGLAREFNSALVRSTAKNLQKVAGGVVDILKRYADGERLAIITGRDGVDEVINFKREQLEGVERFVVELQSSFESNAAGRAELAAEGYAKGDLTLEEYVHTLRTGNFSEKWKAPKASRELIREENEALENLQGVAVVLTDDHPRHIQEHAAILASQRARGNQALINHVLGHMQKHMSQWVQMPADMRTVLGIPPPPSLAPGPPAPPGEGGPPVSPGEGGPLASFPQASAPPIDPGTGSTAPVPPGPEIA